MAVYSYNGVRIDTGGSVEGSVLPIYNALDYGISAEAENNTPALQALMDLVHSVGGGMIFFPIGTYEFARSASGSKYAVESKSNVSIIGENIEKTVFHQSEAYPYSMFYRMGTSDDPITGITYSGFTIDAYDTGTVNAVYGKGIFFTYVKNSVFRDIIIKGTVATGMGTDFLNQCVIDNVTCIDCGRTYTGTQAGTSGIGIGTGRWTNENLIISNCVCVGCGQYGIFIEHQSTIGDTGSSVSGGKGIVITNCVVRNGLNKGIGIRSGDNVIISDCVVYENKKSGIYVGACCFSVKVSNCVARQNKTYGFEISPSSGVSRQIVIDNNLAVNNTLDGIRVAPTYPTHNLVIRDNNCFVNVANGITVDSTNITGLALVGNYTNKNVKGLIISGTHTDLVAEHNVFVDGIENNATMSGDTSHQSDLN